ncbi:putative inorganic phosphate cotransporter [Anoplophora glabripennis]|uniref:putative inorganic phosphate cotransporter n=1 Tax=Anoplophora glabripennis TaxID=217634 RepID=UPI000874B0B4|nr:putative inorganic phosphate cotransporter [Anoplophora glabripennis]
MDVLSLLCCRNGEADQDLHATGQKLGYRHVQMALYFLLMTYTYCMRSVLSVAIVAMNSNSTTPNPDIPIYHWDNQSVVLSAFFWGYAVLQLPSAQLGKRFGVKWLLVGCTMTNAGFCILIPLFAEYCGSVGVIISRFFQGLAQGCIPSLLHNLLGHWAPPSERSVIGTISYSGAVFGNILALSTTGLISSSWVGWPFAFYLFGALGVKWALLWILFGADRPGLHKNISAAERTYIETSLAYQDRRVIPTPWKAILTSLPFWAITLSFVGANWGSSVLMTEIPTYLDKILDYDIKSDSILSAAPYVAMWICSVIFSPICDMLINREIVSRGGARKIFSSIGTMIPAVSLGLVGFMPKDRPGLSVALLIINGGISAGGLCGFQVNHLDLSPNHSGILMGLTNGFSSIFSIISPLIVQYIVTDKTNLLSWRIIFIITASIYAVANVFYCIFGSGEVQAWNDVEEDEEEVPIL